MSPNALATGGMNSTRHIIAMDRSAAPFRYLLVKGPVLMSERPERMLKAWNTWDSAITMKAMVRPPASVPVRERPTLKPMSASAPNMTPCSTTCRPMPCAKTPSFLDLGRSFITPSSMASMPSAMAGRLSVTRFIHNSCMDRNGDTLNSSMDTNTLSSSPMLVPSRKPTHFLMFA